MGNTKAPPKPDKPAPTKKPLAPPNPRITPRPTVAPVAYVPPPPPQSALEAASQRPLDITQGVYEDPNTQTQNSNRQSKRLNTVAKRTVQRGILDSVRERT
jgi:hypothetical protein